MMVPFGPLASFPGHLVHTNEACDPPRTGLQKAISGLSQSPIYLLLLFKSVLFLGFFFFLSKKIYHMMIAKIFPANLPSVRQVSHQPIYALATGVNATQFRVLRPTKLRECLGPCRSSIETPSYGRRVGRERGNLGQEWEDWYGISPEPSILNPNVGGLYIDVSKTSVRASLPCPSNTFISVWQFVFASACDSVNAKFEFTLFPSFNIDFPKRPNHFRWLGRHSPKSPWLTSCFRIPPYQ